MVLVFVVVEDNATHIGYFPIVFEQTTDQVEVESAPARGNALQTGDRVDLQALTQPQRFALLWRRASEHDNRSRVSATAAASQPVTASAHRSFAARTFARDVGTPLCFFLSLALASALFLMRPRPITLAFYLYTMLMLVKVNQTRARSRELADQPGERSGHPSGLSAGAAHDSGLRAAALRAPEPRVALVLR